MTPTPTEQTRISRTPVQVGFFVTLIGLFIFTMGAKPEWYGMDRSPIVGFVQIAVFLVGLAIICIGGYVGLVALWGDDERSIAADIGLRLVSTGYVLSVFTGMADVFGMGTQPLPQVPFFGPLQSVGMEIGQGLILFGFLLTIPRRKNIEKTKKRPNTIE